MKSVGLAAMRWLWKFNVNSMKSPIYLTLTLPKDLTMTHVSLFPLRHLYKKWLLRELWLYSPLYLSESSSAYKLYQVYLSDHSLLLYNLLFLCRTPVVLGIMLRNILKNNPLLLS